MRPVPPPALIAFGGLKCMRSRRGAARSVAAPFPARHARPAAAAAGGRPRPLPRAGASPRLLPPSLRVLVAPSARKGSFLRPLAALALALRLAPLLRPFPRSRGAPGRCGASSRPFALGSRSLRAGSPVPPCPAPLRGVRSLSLPRGGSCWRGLRRAFWCLRRPRGVWAGAAAAAAAARLRLSVSPRRRALGGCCSALLLCAVYAASSLRLLPAFPLFDMGACLPSGEHKQCFK